MDAPDSSAAVGVLPLELLPQHRGRRAPGARYYVDGFGDDNLVFSTDYPHGDSKYPHAVIGFLDLPVLTDDSKRKILWDNWGRLYGMPL